MRFKSLLMLGYQAEIEMIQGSKSRRMVEKSAYRVLVIHNKGNVMLLQ